MRAPDLLSALRARGVGLAAIGDRLEYDGPAEVMTPRLLETLRQAKPALLALLEQRPGWNEEEAWSLIHRTYRAVGETVPGGAIAWCAQREPLLSAAVDAATAEWEAAFNHEDMPALAAALQAFADACSACAAAAAPSGQDRPAAPKDDHRGLGVLSCR